MKKFYVLLAGVTVVLMSSYGCVSTKEFNASMQSMEDRIGKLEQAQKADAATLQTELKKNNDAAAKADDAAARAEASAKKAEDSANKADFAAKAAASSEKNAETAASKSAKQFELMQKK